MFNRRKPLPAPRFIKAKRPGVCPETGKAIQVGDEIAWFPETQKAFHEDSRAASELRGQQFAQAYNMADANY